MTVDNSVAILGLSCKFPGEGSSLEKFWKSICSGESAWSEIPQERFDVNGFWSPYKGRNVSITRGAHFLNDDISRFDANFFSIPKAEVEAIDPQQRIIIEVAYEALENAGLPLNELAGTKTGVFMGHFTSDYKEKIYRDPDNAPLYSLTGTCKTSLANRISWLWDLKGPSFTVDTACSSSLVALHLACQSLRSRESDTAIVGGTSLLLNPEVFAYMSNQGFLSPDGRCKSFDESANGYGRGEGFGCVVLRRINDAISISSPIRAVIRGTGVNQDGRTKGFTMPSAAAQAALIRETYQRAGIGMEATSYVEAHGTGTQSGDVEEMTALSKTIGSFRTARNKLVVGSVKSNIGHLEAAAGIAGIIKAALILERGLIPPSINFKKGNPNIKFTEWNLDVPTTLIPWPTNGTRRISTNSFGYGGTNAHSILESADGYLQELFDSSDLYGKGLLAAKTFNVTNGHSAGEHEAEHTHNSQLFLLSSQDREGLGRVIDSLSHYVRGKIVAYGGDIIKVKKFLLELSYTLCEKRSRLQWRTYICAQSPDKLESMLNNSDSSQIAVKSSPCPRIGFVFTGQGAQWPRMGVELMACKIFKDSILAADRYLRDECECSWSAVEELNKWESESLLRLAEFSQPICTLLQVALVDLLRALNIIPTAVTGHSSGEIAAAYCVGAITKEDAWKIAYFRGLLSSNLKTIEPELDGSMMVVGLSHENAEVWLSEVTNGEVVIACINSPTSITVSGDTKGIDQLFKSLREKGIFARKLLVDTAYHSPHMQLVAPDYYGSIADITPQESTNECKMYSSVTGTFIEASQLGVANWVKNLTSPVLFSAAIYDMLRPSSNNSRAEENEIDLLVEIGPHPALRGPSMQTLEANGIREVPYYSAIARNQNALDTVLELAGQLFVQGAPVKLSYFMSTTDGYTHAQRPLIDLPPYPWNHGQRYWHESRIEKQYRSRKNPKQGLLGTPIPGFGPNEKLWRGFIRLSEHTWIADHKIQGSVLYPGAGFLAMLIEAAAQTIDQTQQAVSYKLRDIQLHSAAVISEDSNVEFVVQLKPKNAGTEKGTSIWTDFVVSSASNGESLVKNCSGCLKIEYESISDSNIQFERGHELEDFKVQYQLAKECCKNSVNPQNFYEDLAAIGLEYGSAFTNVIEIHNGSSRSLCTLNIPNIDPKALSETQRSYIIHPTTLDSVFHLAFAALKDSENDLTATMVPKSIGEITILGSIPFRPNNRLTGFSKSHKHGIKEIISDIVMMDEPNQAPVIEIRGLRCVEVLAATSNAAQSQKPKSIFSKLIWKPAIEFLELKEQQRILERKKGFDIVAEYTGLLHHTNPAISVLEYVPFSEDVEYDVISTGLVNLDRILRTGSVTIASQNGAKFAELQQDQGNSSEFAVKMPNKTNYVSIESLNSHQFDFVMTRIASLDTSEVEEALGTILKHLKIGGRLCILTSGRTVDHALTYLRGLETMVIDDNASTASQQSNFIIGQNTEPLSANDVPKHATVQEVTIIQMMNPTKFAQTLALEISTNLETSGCNATIIPWGSDTVELGSNPCISLVELERSLLENLTSKDFNYLYNLVQQTTEIFWVVGFADPSAAIVDGLARSLRNEIPKLSFRIFHTPKRCPITTSSLSSFIGRAFISKSEDDEFLLQNNIIHVSRIEPDEVLDNRIGDRLRGTPEILSGVPLEQIRSPAKLNIQIPGKLDTLCLEPDSKDQDHLMHDYIEIKVKASAIDSNDIRVALGQASGPELGFDAAGIVRRVGSSVKAIKVGDRVATYGLGSHCTVYQCQASYCALIPEDLSFEQAAAIPTVHCTAWNALIRLARVQKGQSILIHAAASCVGQIAVQVAKYYGMVVFVTVASDAQRALIRDKYAIPDHHILTFHDLGFIKAIKRMTENKGVDVIIGSMSELSREILRETWYCIAPFGHFVEIGFDRTKSNSGFEIPRLTQDATYSFFNIAHVARNRPEVMAEAMEGAFDFQRRGVTKSVHTLITFPISEVESAFRLMQNGQHVGRVLLAWEDNYRVRLIQRSPSNAALDSNGVFLLSGGLGGLGRSLSRRLVDNGARKLCFLSRSGNESPQSKELIRDLSARGVQIKVIKCDVADSKALSIASEKCERELGRVCGVIQCAMVLRDSLFINMNHDQWSQSTRPKIQGSWNLHLQFPDVDFFLLLSSFAAVFGNRGQSNYAAGGAYEDALAYHRRNLGQHAVALDLGIMRDIGVLAETEISSSLRDWEKPYGIRESVFLALIEQSIAGDVTGTISPQILSGLATQGSAIAAGIKAPYYLADARFSVMAKIGDYGKASDTRNVVAPHALISRASSIDDASGHVLKALIDLVANLLQTTASEIDSNRYLHSYGIDSLIAIEITNWALHEIQSVITVFDVLDGVPLKVLSYRMAEKSAALPKKLVHS